MAIRIKLYLFLADDESNPDRAETSTGYLPTETEVAHKTGYSGRHADTGVIAASNDVGIIVLPDGNAFAISVFVSDSKEGPEKSEKIIAEVAKACWDYFQREQ